jgi:hypothetical protein
VFQWHYFFSLQEAFLNISFLLVRYMSLIGVELLLLLDLGRSWLDCIDQMIVKNVLGAFAPLR